MFQKGLIPFYLCARMLEAFTNVFKPEKAVKNSREFMCKC